MSVFRTRFRIIRDGYAGFEVQGRPWWLPAWIQLGRYGGWFGVNTHLSIEQARDFLSRWKSRSEVVEYIE